MVVLYHIPTWIVTHRSYCVILLYLKKNAPEHCLFGKENSATSSVSVETSFSKPCFLKPSLVITFICEDALGNVVKLASNLLQ